MTSFPPYPKAHPHLGFTPPTRPVDPMANNVVASTLCKSVPPTEPSWCPPNRSSLSPPRGPKSVKTVPATQMTRREYGWTQRIPRTGNIFLGMRFFVETHHLREKNPSCRAIIANEGECFNNPRDLSVTHIILLDDSPRYEIDISPSSMELDFRPYREWHWSEDKLIGLFGKLDPYPAWRRNRAKIIVRPQWVEECVRAGRLVSTNPFEVRGRLIDQERDHPSIPRRSFYPSPTERYHDKNAPRVPRSRHISAWKIGDRDFDGTHPRDGLMSPEPVDHRRHSLDDRSQTDNSVDYQTKYGLGGSISPTVNTKPLSPITLTRSVPFSQDQADTPVINDSAGKATEESRPRPTLRSVISSQINREDEQNGFRKKRVSFDESEAQAQGAKRARSDSIPTPPLPSSPTRQNPIRPAASPRPEPVDDDEFPLAIDTYPLDDDYVRPQEIIEITSSPIRPVPTRQDTRRDKKRPDLYIDIDQPTTEVISGPLCTPLPAPNGRRDLRGPTAMLGLMSSTKQTSPLSPPITDEAISPVSLFNQPLSDQSGRVEEKAKGFFRHNGVPTGFSVVCVDPAQTEIYEFLIVEMGQGEIVSLDKAKIVILSFRPKTLTRVEFGEIAYDQEDESVLRRVETDPTRSLVSFEWVEACCKLGKVLGVSGYIVRLPCSPLFV